ncbi:restriction endonuclease subunit S [Pseudomonas sp. SWRI92]|uniref:Restriction endonuclease subunit S n=1 Tax=Pseudomonas marvdashtae TaxID=2745500 RepID=A0A923JSI0_9PSED|nr:MULTISPECIES: restriction endonuclease subunit S [Pseudomonas]MBC3375940.1 restriction endonuclease subunit S [Pseudomonas sp. SWRI92]MBV4550170.1 restriction endonuclease subunit S [Pseudomonas marvdashtae]
MSKLPAGWATCRLADIGHIVTGKTPSTKEPAFYGGSIPFIKPGDLDHSGPIVRTETSLTNAGAAEVPVLPPQSIVVTCIGNLGKVGLTTTTSATNQQINALIPDTGIDPSFVFHYCKTLRPWLEAQSSATTISIVNKSIFSKAPIPLPPAAEQIRIAAKLDELLAQVDILKARIDAIPTLLKRFRQSVLAAAFSGRLTEEWRGYTQNNSTHGWAQTTVGNLCKLKSGIAISAEYEKTTGDFKYFKVGEMNLKGNEFHLQHTDRYLAKGDAPEKSLMPSGSILFPKRGGAIATNKKRILKEPSFVDLNIMGIITPVDVEIMYVYRWFETIDLAKLNTGSTIPQINNTDIAPLEIPLPPSAEQSEIVRRVEQLFTYADQLESKVTSAKSRIDHLTQSILVKAFRGELVPQDPNDEPASALLERIQAQRAAAPKVKRGRKST